MIEQKRYWQIREKKQEMPGVVSLTLEPDDGQPAIYAPGQYLTVIRNLNDREERRAYSFSSAPRTDPYPVITVKRIPNGACSTWLAEQAVPGDRLLCTGPAGRFVLPKEPPRHLVFLAAGSGITPIMSQLKTIFTDPAYAQTLVTLYYANRDSVHTIFKAQIDRWIEAFPERFSCTYLFSREKGAANSLYRHLNNELFEQLLYERLGSAPDRDRAGTHFYICAPNPLMRMGRMTLRLLDFPEEHIHQEVFQPNRPVQVRPVDTNRRFHIRVNSRKNPPLQFDIYAGESILNGALRQGIDLPYTCKSGVCFTCLARCTKGMVEVQFTDQTKQEGPGNLVNTCIGYPVTKEVELMMNG
ncbi:MAG: ferredoxin--NADP reductase [Bacteroidetes bacterium]|nr:MAG: ferredoxin--NADP reductase [Bacteroidota bacterium]